MDFSSVLGKGMQGADEFSLGREAVSYISSSIMDRLLAVPQTQDGISKTKKKERDFSTLIIFSVGTSVAPKTPEQTDKMNEAPDAPCTSCSGQPGHS